MDKLPLTLPSNLKSVLNANGFHMKKILGQNFLINPHVVERIIEGSHIQKDDYVLEIGPGVGSLTQSLAEHTDHLLAVELDRQAAAILKDTVAPFGPLVIVEGDVLKEDIEGLFKHHFENFKPPIKVVANLPYYITTPIIMQLLEDYDIFESITVMVQKEVGERIVAKEGNKTYGAISVACQYYAECEKLIQVSPNSFYPPPKVDSIVLKLTLKQEGRLEKEAADWMFKIVRHSFNQRRKTLLNSLAPLFNGDKALVGEILEKGGIDKNRRGETLSLNEFKNLGKVANSLL